MLALSDMSVQSITGLTPRVATAADTGVAASTQRAAVSSTDRMGIISPSNPLTWFGVFLLVTVGAASAAGSLRLGKFKVSAQAGS